VNRKSVFLGVLAALWAGSAPASNWVPVGKNNAGTNYDVDWDSIRRQGNLVTFTVRVQYAPAIAQTGADGFTAIRQANCADRTYTDIHTDYMKGGKVLNSTKPEDKQKAAAGSTAAAMLDKVCSR
jgi:hypothetical protein